MHLFHALHARRNGREDVIRFLPAMSLECTKLAIARRQGPCMTAASAWLRAACFFGSAEGQSDVSHRCARVYISLQAFCSWSRRPSSLSNSHSLGGRIKQGWSFPLSADGKVDKQFHRPIHKDTCTHASAHNKTSYECMCIRTYKGYSVVPSMWPPGTIGLPTFSNVYFGSTGIPMAFGSQDQKHS